MLPLPAIEVPTGKGLARVELRRLGGLADYRQAEELQTRVWGAGDVVWVPSLVLITAQENGGFVLGAFDGGHLVGFVCSYPGIAADGRVKQTSQLMAVDPAYQHNGVGYQLKRLQREMTLEAGLDLITWTFDPLASANANLNVRKLGCVAERYLRNFYGQAETGINAGLPTDRFLAEWWIREPRVERLMAGVSPPAPAPAPRVNEVVERASSGLPENRRRDLDLDDPVVSVEVPADLGAMKRSDLGLARAWRLETREIFERYLGRGYRVTGFGSTDSGGGSRCRYFLERRDRAPA